MVPGKTTGSDPPSRDSKARSPACSVVLPLDGKVKMRPPKRDRPLTLHDLGVRTELDNRYRLIFWTCYLVTFWAVLIAFT